MQHASFDLCRARLTLDPDILVIVFEGQLDLARQVEFHNKLRTAYDHPKVIIDLSKVDYVDSSFLSTLVVMRARRREKNFTPACLVGLSPTLLRVLRITGLDEMWPIYDTQEEARGQLKRK